MKNGFIILALAFVFNGFSASIEIIDMRHSTELSLTSRVWTGLKTSTTTNYSQSQTSFGAVGDTMINPRTGLLAAQASAGSFEVYGSTPSTRGRDSYFISSRAIATSEIWFSPLNSETANLSMFLAASGHFYDCSSWEFSLLNVTTGEELWKHQWFGIWKSGTLLYGESALDFSSTVVDLRTDFHATDIYKLTMYTKTFADDSPRSPTVMLQLSGLEITSVPEPTILSLVGFGLLIGLVRRR